MDSNGMSWTEIAKSAYLAYSASTENKNYQGSQMPEFENLPERIRLAWECAVRQVDRCFHLRGEHFAGTIDETSWEQWTKNKLEQK